MANTRVLISGGAGFIGKSFTRKLLDQKIEVVLLDLNPNHHDPFTKGAKLFKGDVRNIQAWSQLPQCDVIYHFAAPSSVILFHENLETCVDVTIKGLVNAFDWAIRTKAKKVVYPSSGSIFNETNTACSETTYPNPANVYGKTKLSCEYIAKIYEDKVPSLGLRIFAGYGPQEQPKGRIASVATLFLQNMLNKKSPIIFGDGNQTRDFVYIDDIVEILYYALRNSDLTGVLNVGSGESISFNKVVDTINSFLRLNIQPTYKAIPPQYLQHTRCDPTRMQQILKKRPIHFSDGMFRYLSSLDLSIYDLSLKKV